MGIKRVPDVKLHEKPLQGALFGPAKQDCTCTCHLHPSAPVGMPGLGRGLGGGYLETHGGAWCEGTTNWPGKAQRKVLE